jgi:hypothetical protein
MWMFKLSVKASFSGEQNEERGAGITLPQPEPNGLFMPPDSEATWIMCSDGSGGVRPVYSEPRLVVSPFPLK